MNLLRQIVAEVFYLPPSTSTDSAGTNTCKPANSAYTPSSTQEMAGNTETSSGGGAHALCPRRSGHVAVCTGENLLVWGGFQTSSAGGKAQVLPAEDLWYYIADNDFWTCRKCAGVYPSSTNGASSVFVDPYWYIIGGWTPEGYLQHVYRLHVKHLQWERVETSSPGLSPRWNFAAWVFGDKIFCFGGYGPDIRTEGLYKHGGFVKSTRAENMFWNNQLLTLDTKTHQWSNPPFRGNPPSPRSGHAAAVLEDKVYVYGGACSGPVMSDLHCLDLSTMTWSGKLKLHGATPRGRYLHTLTSVGKDRLLLFGGLSADEPLDDLWMLIPSTKEWTLLKGSTGHPRHYHTACSTESGNILVFGGCVDNIMSEDYLPRFSEQILQLQIRPRALKGANCKFVLDFQAELGRSHLDFVDARPVEGIPRLPSLHEIQEELPTEWPSLQKHNPEDTVIVQLVAEHDRAMRHHFEAASAGTHKSVYRMHQEKRGLFLLINNEDFEGARRRYPHMKDRKGTDVDGRALTELFGKLGFKVVPMRDLTAEEMRQALRKILSEDHSAYDCFACAILSHGTRGAVFGKDGETLSIYGTDNSWGGRRTGPAPESLTDIVTRSGCKTLAGKPKLFFIQACQGEGRDPGIQQWDQAGLIPFEYWVTKEASDSGGPEKEGVVSDHQTCDVSDSGDHEEEGTESDQADTSGVECPDAKGILPSDTAEELTPFDSQRIPAGADLFIADATTLGFISVRHTKYGTWFMQALVYVFSKYAHMLDILDLMTTVHKLVSVAQTELGGYMQQPCSRTALNKKLYFFPGLHKPRR